MGCVQSPDQKGRGFEQIRRSSTYKSARPKAQNSSEYDNYNSLKPKIMPIISDQEDYNPMQENYLAFAEPVKPPVQTPEFNVQNVIGNSLYDFEDSNQLIPDFAKYKVPKITYPKLQLSVIGPAMVAAQKKRKEKSEVKE